MFRTRLQRRIASSIFRGTALVAMFGFAASVVGVPLPVVTPGNAESKAAASTRGGCCCSVGKRAGQCCGRCGCSQAKPVSVTANDQTPQFEFVLSILARKCQGQAEVWLALGAVAPPPEVVQLAPELPCRGQLACESFALDTLPRVPATPPPRA